jgi:hypothetical protein
MAETEPFNRPRERKEADTQTELAPEMMEGSLVNAQHATTTQNLTGSGA